MAAETYPHVRVHGSPRERGRQYGQLTRSRVRRSVEAYAGVFRRWADLDWGEVRTLAEAYVPAIEAHEPRYLEELGGIAEGAGLDFRDVLAINVRTEVMFSAKARAAEALGRVPGECTSLVVLPSASAAGHTLAAQNWDWLAHARETVVVLEVEQDEGPHFVTLVEAGLLAKFGMNAAGVGVLTNTLVCEHDRGEPSIPYHVVLRSLLDATSITDALSRLQAITRASSANYLLAHRDGLAVDVEAMAGDFARLLIEQPRDGLLAHTNHYLSPRFPARDVGLWVMPDSLFRLQSTLEYLRPRLGRLEPESIQRALSLHANHPEGVCTHPDESLDAGEQGATVVSAIMDLDDRLMWIADGNPCTTGYRLVDYSAFLGR